MNLLLNPTSFDLWSYQYTSGGSPFYTFTKDFATNPTGTDNLADLVIPDVNSYNGIYQNITLQPNTTYYFSIWACAPYQTHATISMRLYQSSMGSIYWPGNTSGNYSTTPAYVSVPVQSTPNGTLPYQQYTWTFTTPSTVDNTQPCTFYLYPLAPYPVIAGSSKIILWGSVLNTDNSTFTEQTLYTYSINTILNTITTNLPSIDLKNSSGTLLTTSFDITRYQTHNYDIIPYPNSYDLTTWSYTSSNLGTITKIGDNTTNGNTTFNVDTNTYNNGDFSGGTNYNDGVYKNVQLSYYSGTSLTTYPTADIYIYSGSISKIILNTFGSGAVIGTSLTCNNSYLGGSGSGFSIKIVSIGTQAGISITNGTYYNPSTTSHLTSNVSTDVGSYGGINYTNLTLLSNKTYTLSFYAFRINPTGSSVSVRIKNSISTMYLIPTPIGGYNTSDNYITIPATDGISTPWTLFTFTFTTPTLSGTSTLNLYLTGQTSIAFYGINLVLGNNYIPFVEPYSFNYGSSGNFISGSDSNYIFRFPSIDLKNSSGTLLTTLFNKFNLSATTPLNNGVSYLGKTSFPYGNSFGQLVNGTYVYKVDIANSVSIINDIISPPNDILNNPAFVGNTGDLLLPSDNINSPLGSSIQWNGIHSLVTNKQYTISCWVKAKYFSTTGRMSISPGGNWNTGLQVSGSEGNLSHSSWKTLNGSYSIILSNDTNNAGLYTDMGIPNTNLIPTQYRLFSKPGDQILANPISNPSPSPNNGISPLYIQNSTSSTIYNLSSTPDINLPSDIAALRNSIFIYQELAYDPSASSYEYDFWGKYANDFLTTDTLGNPVVSIDATKTATITAWAIKYPMLDGTDLIKIYHYYGNLTGEFRYQFTQAYNYLNSNQDLTKPTGYGFFFSGYLTLYGGIRIYNNDTKSTPISISPTAWNRVSLTFNATLEMNNLTNFYDRPGNINGSLFSMGYNSWNLTAFQPTNPDPTIYTSWSPKYSAIYLYGLMINEGSIPTPYYPDKYILTSYPFSSISPQMKNPYISVSYPSGIINIKLSGIKAYSDIPHHHIGINVTGASYFSTARIFLNIMKLSDSGPNNYTLDPAGAYPASTTHAWRLYRSAGINDNHSYSSPSANVFDTRLYLDNSLTFISGSTTMTTINTPFWNFDTSLIYHILIGTNVANNTTVLNFTTTTVGNITTTTWTVDKPFIGNSDSTFSYYIKKEVVDDISTCNLDSDGYPRYLPNGYYLYCLAYRTTTLSFLLINNSVNQLNLPFMRTGLYTITWDGNGVVSLNDDLTISPTFYPATLLTSNSNSATYYVDCSGNAPFTIYHNVTLTYVSGTIPTTAPIVTIVIGIKSTGVDNVFISTPAVGGDDNTIYSCNNIDVGGTGSGFTYSISHANNNYGNPITSGSGYSAYLGETININYNGSNYTIHNINAGTSASYKYYNYLSNGKNTLEGYIAINSQSGFAPIIKSTDSNNHVNNIKLFETQYQSLISSGQIFYPEFLTRLYDYKCLRFLDWVGINGRTNTRNLNTITKVSHCSYVNTNFVPFEIIINLCNILKKDCWLNLPVYSSDGDSFYQYIAELFETTLDPSLRLYVEFGNEQWNGGLGSGYWLTQAAINLNIVQTSVLNPPNPNFYNHMYYYAMLSQHVFDIFERVFSGGKSRLSPPRLWDNPKTQKRRMLRCLSTGNGAQAISSQVWRYALPFCKNEYNIPYDVICPNGYYDIVGMPTVNANAASAAPNEYNWTKEELIPLFTQALNDAETSEYNAAHGLVKSTITTNTPTVLGYDSDNELYDPVICFYEGGFGSAGPTPLMLKGIIQLAYEEDYPTNTVYNLSKNQYQWWENYMVPLMQSNNQDVAVYNQWETSLSWNNSDQWGLSDKSNYTDTQYYSFPRARLYNQTSGRIGQPLLTILTTTSAVTYASKPKIYINGQWVYMSNIMRWNGISFEKVSADHIHYWDSITWK